MGNKTFYFILRGITRTVELHLFRYGEIKLENLRHEKWLMTPFKFAIKTKYTATKRIHRLHASYHSLVFPLFLLGVGNLGSDNSLKWPQISTK